MATKTETNTSKAMKALKAEYSAGVREFAESAELLAYVAELDTIIQEARDLKGFYKNRLAVIASQKSRAARKARVEKALQLLEAQEAEQDV
jgi:hypothetical protein